MASFMPYVSFLFSISFIGMTAIDNVPNLIQHYCELSFAVIRPICLVIVFLFIIQGV